MGLAGVVLLIGPMADGDLKEPGELQQRVQTMVHGSVRARYTVITDMNMMFISLYMFIYYLGIKLIQMNQSCRAANMMD